MKLTAAQNRLLFEAFRRNQMDIESKGHEYNKPILSRWLGLGTEAAYRPVLNSGLMRFFDGRTPYKRCMGWLCLTPLGLEVMNENTKEFKQYLNSCKEQGYDNSILANYSLAGGITK